MTIGDMQLLCRDDFIGYIVAVLLSVKHPPAIPERTWILGTQNSMNGCVAVRNMDACNFIISRTCLAQERIDSCRSIAPLGKYADWLIDPCE